jgi:DNA-directed RNA polymerase subunit N (RpoN/RPB10)
MARMLPGIETVEQHQERFREDPDAYRPERCPSCGRAGLPHHGHYERKAPRGEGLAFSLDPLLIPRFLCPWCGSGCSRLPACVA